MKQWPDDFLFQEILAEIKADLQPVWGQGQVADYIPELAGVDPDKFGMCLHVQDGEQYVLGDAHERFSIQSISKVFTLTLAIARLGEKLWERVDVEPSGNPFNSLVQLEYEQGIPRNPFINAGALVVCDVLLDEYEDALGTVLEFVRKLADAPSIDVNAAVAASEKAYGFRNIALANFIRSFGNLRNDIEQVLDLYFQICAIEMSCVELAQSFLFYTCHGYRPFEEAMLTPSQVRRMNALMQTCGFYDEAGEFAYEVGLPGKSGVGGGIVAFHPNRYSVAVWSPRLNPKGNSLLAMLALERLTTKLELSIF